jgi:hypothetical protein
MPDTPAPNVLPVPVRIANSYRQLAASAVELKQATDDFTKVTAPLDELLQQLNLGVECWVRISKWDHDDGIGEYRELGYAKVGERWGVALRSQIIDDTGDLLRNEVWLFNDGPRTFRIDAIEKVPELLDELAKKASKFTRKVRKSTDTARAVVDALQQAAADAGIPKPAKGAAR